jgi:hypothetical protein
LREWKRLDFTAHLAIYALLERFSMVYEAADSSASLRNDKSKRKTEHYGGRTAAFGRDDVSFGDVTCPLPPPQFFCISPINTIRCADNYPVHTETGFVQKMDI